MEAIEVCKITRLVDLVDVCLFGREMDVFANFVTDIAKEGIVDEVLDHGVLVAVRSIRRWNHAVRNGAYGCDSA